MAAKFEDSRKYESSKEALFTACKKAIEQCKFEIESAHENEGLILAKTKLSWLSWTEKFKVQIKEDGVVSAKSECFLPTQIVAWGKNKKNVKNFFSALEVKTNVQMDNV